MSGLKLFSSLPSTLFFPTCSKKQVKVFSNWCNVFPVVNIAKQVDSLRLHQLYHPNNLQTKGMMNYVVRRDVCQGSMGLVLELILFNIFINDLEKRVSRPLIKLADIAQK